MLEKGACSVDKKEIYLFKFYNEKIFCRTILKVSFLKGDFFDNHLFISEAKFNLTLRKYCNYQNKIIIIKHSKVFTQQQLNDKRKLNNVK